ncbi:MAG: hypothetical protein F4W90_09710 [Gammaproteobacteria bacterium]|nr:hypothetical protein [Gammaproteobacteria bacterium]
MKVKATPLNPHLDNHKLRWRRSESWSEAAKTCFSEGDFDSAVIFYWISLNSLFAVDNAVTSQDPPTSPAKTERDAFLRRLQEFDKQEGGLYHLMWQQYSQTIQPLLNNKFVYGRYWEAIKDGEDDTKWREAMDASKNSAQKALTQQGSLESLLIIIFDRLNVLRNQLVHGSATKNGSRNRSQVHTGAHLLHTLVPEIQRIFKQNSTKDWGEPPYKPQEDQ